MKLSAIMPALIVLLLSFMPAEARTDLRQSVDEPYIGTTQLSRSDQWHNLKRWVSLTFDRTNVIDMEDPERGTMIIKWSCPVEMPSDYIGASVAMTYVIDVRDGKYRLQRLSPRIVYQFVRPDAVDYFDGAVSPDVTADIKLITDISRQYFNKSPEWPVNNRYRDIAAAYLAATESVPRYRNDRDRERNKINDDWRRAERDWMIIGKPLATLQQLDASMIDSLVKSLTTNDDF